MECQFINLPLCQFTTSMSMSQFSQNGILMSEFANLPIYQFTTKMEYHLAKRPILTIYNYQSIN